jgi:hypothetical protein
MSEFASLLPYPVQLFIIAILGLALGSFATALTHRVPKGMDWGLFQKTRSQCPSCGKTLGAVDLVPVFSWVFLKGKCRQCKAPISPVYPLVELLTVAAVLGVYAAFGPTVQGLIAICAMPFLAALLAIDLKQYILPDALVLVLFPDSGRCLRFDPVGLGLGDEQDFEEGCARLWRCKVFRRLRAVAGLCAALCVMPDCRAIWRCAGDCLEDCLQERNLSLWPFFDCGILPVSDFAGIGYDIRHPSLPSL